MFFFHIFVEFRDIWVQEIAKITPSLKFGEIFVRLYLLGKVLHSRHIATYIEIFIQIGPHVRKISSDKLLRTHGQTHTRQAKKQFYWRSSISTVRKYALVNFEFFMVL